MNKPQIRFKGFTDPWEQYKLGNISEFYTGDSFSKELKKDGKYIVMDMGSIDSQGNRIEIKKTNTCRDLLQKGDLVMPKDDIGGGLIIGRTGYIPKNGKYVLGDHVYRLRLNNSLNGCFASYYINSNHIRRQIIPKVTGSAQLGLNSKNLADVILKFPKNTEQELIGNYFEKLDNLINFHQRKYDKLVNFKKSMLEKMFPKDGENVPEIRFKGFTDPWEQRKLEEYIIDLKSGLSRMLSEQDIGLPVVRANNIENDKLDMTHDVKYWYVDDPQGANTSNYLISKDDILINFINSEAKMGTAAIVEKKPIRNTIYTTNILKMQLKSDCNIYFFLAQTHTRDYVEYIKGISKIAVNQASFTTVDFKNYKIKLPRLQEQNKIGDLFKKMDSLITLHQRKLELYKNIKKSLLEKMFV